MIKMFFHIVFLLVVLFQNMVAATCPGSETSTVGNKKLYYHNSEVTWDTAKTSCTGQTFILAFENADEFEAIKSKPFNACIPIYVEG